MSNAKIRVGKGKIAISNLPKGKRPMASSNKAALALSKSGTKDLLEGTMELNRELEADRKRRDASVNKRSGRLAKSAKRIYNAFTR